MCAYLDDLVICSNNAKFHFETLRKVLQRLQSAGLKVKLAKCEFMIARVTFLGHKIDGQGIHTMDDIVKVVKNFPQPRSVENVRSFLWLAGYYRPFILSFARITQPLTQFLTKEVTYVWVTP